MTDPMFRDRGYSEPSALPADRQALVNAVRDHADKVVSKSPDASTVWDDWSRELSLFSDREINEQIGPKVTSPTAAIRRVDYRYVM